MAITQIAKARNCGQVRFHTIYQYPVELNRILGMCYLKPEAEKLLEINREQATQTLVCWLHRDAAYKTELMSVKSAQALAEDFVREFSNQTSRFFTNGRWFDQQETTSWQPLTESIFDGGILIESGKGNDTCHVCLWFEDED